MLSRADRQEGRWKYDSKCSHNLNLNLNTTLPFATHFIIMAAAVGSNKFGVNAVELFTGKDRGDRGESMVSAWPGGNGLTPCRAGLG